MKHTRSALIIMVSAAMLCLFPTLVSFADTGETIIESSEYIKEKIIPVAVALLSMLGALYIGVLPIIRKVRSASERFEAAADDVSTSNKNNLDIKSSTAACISRINEISEKNDKELENIRKILMIGFCNSDELVKKGYASKIARLLGEPVQYEKEDEPNGARKEEDNENIG